MRQQIKDAMNDLTKDPVSAIENLIELKLEEQKQAMNIQWAICTIGLIIIVTGIIFYI